MKKEFWKTVVQIVVTVLTALGTALTTTTGYRPDNNELHGALDVER